MQKRQAGDGLDAYRKEYNGVLTEKAIASNNLIQDKYITVSVARKGIDEDLISLTRPVWVNFPPLCQMPSRKMRWTGIDCWTVRRIRNRSRSLRLAAARVLIIPHSPLPAHGL